MSIKPHTRSNHVGIEIEFVSKYPRTEIEDLLILMDMHNFCEVVTDGSITYPVNESDPEYFNWLTRHGLELRVISTENDLPDKLQMVQAFLDIVVLDINKSCGLHVHIDMRQRHPAVAQRRLVSNERLLMQLTPRSRLDSEYCQPTYDYYPKVQDRDGDFYVPFFDDDTLDDYSRYRGINFLAYNKLKTFEIRFHEGTQDMGEVFNWCQLLIAIVDGRKEDSGYVKKRTKQCA